jgi:hypothetical protein
VKFETAPLVDAYARRWDEGCRDWIDVVLMIELPGLIGGIAAFDRKKAA